MPDPDFAEDKDNFEITDLDTPSKTSKISNSFANQKKWLFFRIRSWMSIGIIAGIALLTVVVLVTVLHVPQPAKMTVQPVQINYPVSLSVANGICYAIAPNGVVTAFRVRDGALIWRHVDNTKGEKSAIVVDGVIYLIPILPNGSHVASMTVEAFRAGDGVSLWSRSLPTDSPATFQLTVVNNIVYVMSTAERIDALRASDGSLLWRYTSSVPFASFPTVSDGMVYTSTQDGHFSALRGSDGFVLWKYTSLNPPQSSPAVLAEGRIFLSLKDGSMDVVGASTGVLLWRYTPHIPALQLFPLILVADGLVFASTQDGHLYALRASDGSTIWSEVIHPSDNLYLMSVTGDVVIVASAFSGNVDALRVSSGSVIWQHVAKAGESVPITVVQGVVYLALYTINANILARITALRASDGKLLWSYTPHTDYRQLLPVVGNDIVLIALQDGSVEALRASDGSLLWRRVSNS